MAQVLDDVLVIGEGTEDTLFEFFKNINTNNHNLKFTMVHDKNTITLLDVPVNLNLEGNLCSTLFCKSATGNTVLHAGSFYPIHLKNSIPYGQYLRLRRNCFNDVLFKKEAGKLQNKLL